MIASGPTDLLVQLQPADAHPAADIVPPGTVVGPVLHQVLEETGLRGRRARHRRRQPRHGQRRGRHPGLDAHSVYLSSGTWSLMGVETAQPIINDKALELQLHQRGRRQQHDPPAQEHHRAVAAAGMRGASGEREGRAITWDADAGRGRAGAAVQVHRQPGRARLLRAIEHDRHHPRLLPPHRSARAGDAWARSCAAAWRAWRLRYRWVVNALEELLTSADGVPGAAPHLGAHRGRRQPEPPAQPVHRRRLRPPGRDRPGRGRRAGQCHDAGCGHRPSQEFGRRPRRHRPLDRARAVRTATPARAGTMPMRGS